MNPLAPEAGAATPNLRDGAPRTGGPTTLALSGLRLVRRPPAPLSVFLNLPKDAEPQLNGPYSVATLNFFNVDLAMGQPMTQGDGADHGSHDAAGRTELRYDVGAILAAQQARGLWDGGSITVTVTTIGAERAGEITDVTFESASLTP
ncbi:hypothetical protein [Methylobacterium sp. JK268]